MKVAHFDCFSGAGGDMIVAALIAAGAPRQALCAGLSGLAIGGHTLSIERANKQGFAATRFKVDLEDPADQPHRHLADILGIITGSTLSDSVKDKASRVFRRLAEAEAAVHGSDIEKVHFHEVGAVDSILDIVGAVLALELLGVEQVTCSPVAIGSGTVKCAHGTLPVPAPATIELLKDIPVCPGDEVGELVTPTAAALLSTLAAAFGPPPAMTLRTVGCGAGTREGRGRPNILRVLVGDIPGNTDTNRVTVLETNLDDVSAETIGYCIERLMAEGALDAYAVPIQMKKSRPGVVLTVLCEPGRVSALERVLFAETPTFGIRRHETKRTILCRHHEIVSTTYGKLRMKVGEGGGLITASPEYEDCRAAAERHGVPLRQVVAAANAAWSAKTDPSG